MALKSIRPPFSCGPAAQVDSAVRNCIRSVMRLFSSFVDVGAGLSARPGPHDAQCSVTSGIGLAWNFEAAESVRPRLL